MKKSYQTAHILAIISGGLGVVWAILLFANLKYAYWWIPVLTLAILLAALGVFGALAGFIALRQKSWGLGLASAIMGIITFFPTGIAAVLLFSLGRKAPGRIPAPA